MRINKFIIIFFALNICLMQESSDALAGSSATQNTINDLTTQINNLTAQAEAYNKRYCLYFFKTDQGAVLTIIHAALSRLYKKKIEENSEYGLPTFYQEMQNDLSSQNDLTVFRHDLHEKIEEIIDVKVKEMESFYHARFLHKYSLFCLASALCNISNKNGTNAVLAMYEQDVKLFEQNKPISVASINSFKKEIAPMHQIEQCLITEKSITLSSHDLVNASKIKLNLVFRKEKEKDDVLYLINFIYKNNNNQLNYDQIKVDLNLLNLLHDQLIEKGFNLTMKQFVDCLHALRNNNKKQKIVLNFSQESFSNLFNIIKSGYVSYLEKKRLDQKLKTLEFLLEKQFQRFSNEHNNACVFLLGEEQLKKNTERLYSSFDALKMHEFTMYIFMLLHKQALQPWMNSYDKAYHEDLIPLFFNVCKDQIKKEQIEGAYKNWLNRTQQHQKKRHENNEKAINLLNKNESEFQKACFSSWAELVMPKVLEEKKKKHEKAVQDLCRKNETQEAKEKFNIWKIWRYLQLNAYNLQQHQEKDKKRKILIARRQQEALQEKMFLANSTFFNLQQSQKEKHAQGSIGDAFDECYIKLNNDEAADWKALTRFPIFNHLKSKTTHNPYGFSVIDSMQRPTDQV